MRHTSERIRRRSPFGQQRTQRGALPLWTLLATFSLLLTACTVITSTDTIDVAEADKCTGTFGYYSLSRTNLLIRIKQDPAKNDNPYILEEITFQPRPDNKHRYCLNYDASPFSDDNIQVIKQFATATVQKPENTGALTREGERTNPSALLQLITSKVIDKSGIVIQKIVRSIFIGLSGNGEFKSGRSTAVDANKLVRVADLEIDPFIPEDMARANRRLRQLGFCLVLEDYTYDVERISPQRYCEQPTRVIKHFPSKAAEIANNQHQLVAKITPGIYYKPRATYRLFIFTKDDPTSTDKWVLSKVQSVELENISPVINVGISRSAFAERRTILVFDNGVLFDMCMSKGAELAGAIEIPLDIVYGLAALPAQTINAQIDILTNRQKLIAAETRLIKAQEAAIDFERRKPGSKPPAKSFDVANFKTENEKRNKPLVDFSDDTTFTLTDDVFKFNKGTEALDPASPFPASGGLRAICNDALFAGRV